MTKRGRKKLIVVTLLIMITIVFLYDQNNTIDITELQIYSTAIPNDFNGFKILQISDLHSKAFGNNQKRIVKKIKDVAPDAIFVTGDSIDSKHYNEDVCVELFEQIGGMAPIYFITGNHEAWSNRFDAFEKRLKDIGVIVLRNESRLITIKESSFLVVGVDDPDFQGQEPIKTQIDENVAAHEDYYTILLSHRPELINVYSESEIDLVFSGHAHGGQVRLPFIGGLVAPNQGWFPEYTSGVYKKSNTTMIVSRGLGNSILPQRIFNRPELIVVTLSN